MDKLIEVRKKLNLTQKETCQRIGVSKSYYEKVEYGIKKPGRNFIAKFKAAFPEEDITAIFFAE